MVFTRIIETNDSVESNSLTVDPNFFLTYGILVAESGKENFHLLKRQPIAFLLKRKACSFPEITMFSTEVYDIGNVMRKKTAHKYTTNTEDDILEISRIPSKTDCRGERKKLKNINCFLDPMLYRYIVKFSPSRRTRNSKRKMPQPSVLILYNAWINISTVGLKKR